MDIDSKTKTEESKKNENVTPSASGESAAKYPDMKLAQTIHQIIMMNKGTLPSSSSSSSSSHGCNDETTNEVLKKIVEEMENPSLYRHFKSMIDHARKTSSSSSSLLDNTMKIDSNAATTTTAKVDEISYSEEQLAQIEEKNKQTMKELEEKVEQAKENAGDMEVLDARIAIAQFAAKSLSKEEALEAYEKVLDLPKLSSGKVMDALMESSRIASFYSDLKKNTELLQKVSLLLFVYIMINNAQNNFILLI